MVPSNSTHLSFLSFMQVVAQKALSLPNPPKTDGNTTLLRQSHAFSLENERYFTPSKAATRFRHLPIDENGLATRPQDVYQKTSVTSLRHQSHRLAAAAILLIVTASSSCQNVPSHHKIMRYHRDKELKAAREIADLRSQYEEGEISQSTYEAKSTLLIEDTPEKAMNALYRDYLLSTRTAPEAGTQVTR